MSFPDRPVAQLLGSNGPVHAVTYSAGPGTYILTGSADRAIRLYNPQPTTGVTGARSGGFVTQPSAGDPSKGGGVGGGAALPEGRLIQTYAEHGYEVLSLACAADNARFASAGGDRTVYLWDVSTAQTLRRFAGHAGRVNCVCFGGAGDALVVSGGFDTTVRLWDTRSSNAKPVQTLTDARDAISAVAVRATAGGSGSSTTIVAASVDGRVRSYDVRAGRLTTDVVSANALTSLSLTRDGRSLLVGALDSRLRLMDCDAGTCLRTYAAPGWRNTDLRVQSLLGGGERYVVAGDEMAPETAATAAAAAPAGSSSSTPPGRIWAWDLLTADVVATVAVPWGPPGTTSTSRAIGRDGREKERRNVTSCLAWQDSGWGDHFCVGGTSGVVTVFGPR